MPNPWRTMVRKASRRVFLGVLYFAAIVVVCWLSPAEETPGKRPRLEKVRPDGKAPANVKPAPLKGVSKSAAKEPELTTDLRFELFRPALGGDLVAQQWAQLLEECEVLHTIRLRRMNETPHIEEKVLGTLRIVTVYGQLDSSGEVVLSGRRFTPEDKAAFKEWINDLQIYGAQGSPQGRAVWGLTPEQFDALFAALSKPVERDLRGMKLRDSLNALPLPREYPLVIRTDADRILKAPDLPATRQDVTGITAGAALAIVLSEAGLGFYPHRRPDGGIELAVNPADEKTVVWPIGWNPPENQTPQQVAPTLFHLMPVEFSEVPLFEVLDEVTNSTGVPSFIDWYDAQLLKMKLETIKVSQKPRQLCCAELVSVVARQANLTRELRIDEAGQPFHWLSPATQPKVPPSGKKSAPPGNSQNRRDER